MGTGQIYWAVMLLQSVGGGDVQTRRWEPDGDGPLKDVVCTEAGDGRTALRLLEYTRSGTRTRIRNPSDSVWRYAGCKLENGASKSERTTIRER